MKNGDKVIVVRSLLAEARCVTSTLVGRRGVVLTDHMESLRGYMVQLDGDEVYDAMPFVREELTLVEEE